MKLVDIKPEHILDMIKNWGWRIRSYINQAIIKVASNVWEAAASKMIPSDPTAEVKLSVEAPGEVLAEPTEEALDVKENCL